VLFRAALRKDSGDIPFHLVDLPGYGFAKVPLSIKKSWRPLVLGYFEKNRDIRVCIFLLDIRRQPSGDDAELLAMMEEQETPTLPVVTKIDKVPKTKRPKQLKMIAEKLDLEWQDLRTVSSQTGEGLPELLEELWEILSGAE